MKRLIVLLALCLSSSACGPATVTVGPAYPGSPSPAYVETWYGGGCWAGDGIGADVWYPDCPWTVGAEYGYYYRHQTHWYLRPAPRGYRPRNQPPPQIRNYPPPSRHHMVRPPVIRDHRRRR